MKLLYFKKVKTEKGQAIVETLFFIPIFVLVSAMLFWAVDFTITRQQLVSAARYGTDILYYTNLDTETVKTKIKKYLIDPKISGRKLYSDRIRDIDIKDNRSGSILNIKTSEVQIKYAVKIPQLFLPMIRVMGQVSNRIPKEIIIKGRSAVLAGFK
ncbi:TadE/TadG family type IV pilus assembly protein [bacterium]